MPTGKVKWFNEQKGFGFITPDEGSKDLFIHISNVEPRGAILQDDDLVEFEVGEGRKGPQATNCRAV